MAGAVCGRKREVGASSEREAGPDHKVGAWRIAQQTFLLVLFELQPGNTLDCQCQPRFQMLLTVTSRVNFYGVEHMTQHLRLENIITVFLAVFPKGQVEHL